jgi:8-oxo-dGTP pyrophosphatase MutT (NUDIX family)
VSLYADALDVLAHWNAPDEHQETLRLAYLDHLEAHPDGLWRSALPAHLTAGALVVSQDRQRVLLNLHRKAERWFHFGGHLEHADMTLAGAALREAGEESGLTGLMVDAEPLHLSRHAVEFCDPRSTVHHLDVRFLAVAEPDALPLVSEESLDVRWWPVKGLPTQDADILEVITLAQRR